MEVYIGLAILLCGIAYAVFNIEKPSTYFVEIEMINPGLYDDKIVQHIFICYPHQLATKIKQKLENKKVYIKFIKKF